MKNLIKLESVSKVYKLDGVQVKALNNVSLQLKTGEFAAIMGPSGSGKSTLMHIIGVLDRPTTGDVYFEEKNILKIDNAQRSRLRNRSIGFVFQQFNLLQRASAVDNVLLPLLYNSNIKRADRRQKAIDVLTNVGLEKRLYHRPNQLSGGQQQRVAIARALINNPKLIIADEPTGNLDTKTGIQIMDILSKLNKQEKTIIIVTHEKQIAKYAEKIINLIDGKITK